MAASQSFNTLPQGFSVYQPFLGAQLQFFPAVGSQELKELVHAYLAGPASTQEKIQAVSLDFLEYAQMTGENSKFYAVLNAPSIVNSPATAGSLQASTPSSFNASPATPSWDFSQISTSSSQSSKQSRQSCKASTSVSRHQPTDFSHLPGMKIMTREGLDVTNAASRGSKTKEQRDHAHLMRVIKACESCRKRKTRCDPSHKKRTTTTAAQAPAAKSSKKAKSTTPERPSVAPSIPSEPFAFDASPFDFDSMAFTDFDGFDFSGGVSQEPWDEFVQYAPMDLPMPDPNFFAASPQYLGDSSGSASPSGSEALRLLTPTSSQLESLNMTPELQASSSLQRSYLDQGGNAGEYADFNLYSPESSFSEDDLMVSLQQSGGRLPPPPGQRVPCDFRPHRCDTEHLETQESSGSAAWAASDLGQAYYDPGLDIGRLPEYAENVSGTGAFASGVPGDSFADVELSMRISGGSDTYGGRDRLLQTELASRAISGLPMNAAESEPPAPSQDQALATAGTNGSPQPTVNVLPQDTNAGGSGLATRSTPVRRGSRTPSANGSQPGAGKVRVVIDQSPRRPRAARGTDVADEAARTALSRRDGTANALESDILAARRSNEALEELRRSAIASCLEAIEPERRIRRRAAIKSPTEARVVGSVHIRVSIGRLSDPVSIPAFVMQPTSSPINDAYAGLEASSPASYTSVESRGHTQSQTPQSLVAATNQTLSRPATSTATPLSSEAIALGGLSAFAMASRNVSSLTITSMIASLLILVLVVIASSSWCTPALGKGKAARSTSSSSHGLLTKVGREDGMSSGNTLQSALSRMSGSVTRSLQGSALSLRL